MTITDAAPTALRINSPREVRAFAGLSMASAAISIDMILPAFARIRDDLGLASDSAATAGLITWFFLGAALGPIPFGLFSDRFGRKPTVMLSCVLFVAGALLAAVLPSMGQMLWARFLWGLASAGLRVVATATIRDSYSGAAMAREMSFVMTIFLVVPIFAPAVGAALILVMPWRATFVACALFGVAIAVWSLRIHETLPAERRQPLQVRQVWVAAAAIGRSRAALGFTLASVVIFGVFSSYLASSERIFIDVFDKKNWFPFIFGGTAFLMGAASLAVARSVERIGLFRLLRVTAVVYLVATCAMFVVSSAAGGRPQLWSFLCVLTAMLVSHNILFPNLTAAAMVPVGHVAGTAAAIMASVATAAGSIVGAQIDHAFDGTVNPFSASFAVSGLLTVALVMWAGTPRRVAAVSQPG